ncbi:MAG: hypothetical protein K2L21_03290 [Muribaculaceae bacterium]|nr:hypothetical protein [Muribaculaceae bacterium]
MRSALIFIFVLAAMAVAAAPPATRDAGDASEMRLHWRVKPALRDTARWGVAWNIVDSANYEAVEIALGNGRYSDAFGREEALLTHYRVREGVRGKLRELTLASGAAMRDKGCSMRLQRRKGMPDATLEVGVTMPEFTLQIKPVAGSGASVFAAAPVDTLLNEWVAEYIPEPRHADFPDTDSLRRYLMLPDDPGEAEWVLYDYQAQPSRVGVGGKYRVATVADGNGGYNVYYISGADVNDGFWHPMKLKGRLLPTGFTDSFELYWLDAFGEAMPGDNAADIEGGSLLRLFFPINNAQMRFRRVIPADNQDGK